MRLRGLLSNELLTEVEMTSFIRKLAVRSLAALVIGSSATAASLPLDRPNEHVAVGTRVSPHTGNDFRYGPSYAWMEKDGGGKVLTL